MELFIIVYVVILFFEILLVLAKKKSRRIQSGDFLTPTIVGFTLIMASVQISDFSRSDITKILVIYGILYGIHYFVINLILESKNDSDEQK